MTCFSRARIALCALALSPSVAMASPLSDLAASMPEGSWAELPTEDISVLAVGAHSGNVIPYAQTMLWDPVTETLIFQGSDHNGPDMLYVTYDAAANRWSTRVGEPLGWAHGYEHLALDVEGRRVFHRTFAIGSDASAHTILENDVGSTAPWRASSIFPDSYAQVAIAIVYVPRLGLVVYNCGETGGQVAIRDEATGAWSEIRGFGGESTYHCIAEYSEAHDVVVLGGGNANGQLLWRLDRSGVIAPLPGVPVEVGAGVSSASTYMGNLTADPNTGDLLVVSNGQFWALDPSDGGVWRRLPDPTTTHIFDDTNLVSSSISNHGVNLYVTCRIGECHVFLYRHAPGSGIPVPDIDGGPPREDAGTDADAGAAMSAPDAAAAADGSAGDRDAGTPPPTAGGCSCRVAQRRASPAALALALLALAWVMRRRTRDHRVPLRGTPPAWRTRDHRVPLRGTPPAWRTRSLVLAALLAACSEASPPRDAGATDAAPGVDGGTAVDADMVDAYVPPPTDAAVATADFATRCAAPGVVRCIGFDTAEDIAGGYGDNHGTFSGATAPMLDTSMRASGESSLLFTIPELAAADTGGSYFTNFSDDLSVQFDGGDTFYVQWRQRFSRELIESSPPGGGGWKQVIIGTGDQPGQLYASCTSLEVVTQNAYYRRFPQMYNSCTGSTSHGAYNPFEEAYGAFDFRLENARPAPFCLYSQGQTDPPTYLPPDGNCFGYVADEWMTFQVGIELGPRTGDEFVGSHVRLWGAREGQPSEPVIDWGPYNLTAGDPSESQRFGKVWLLPYNTGRDDTVTNPAGRTWYDELIVSRERIADPQ